MQVRMGRFALPQYVANRAAMAMSDVRRSRSGDYVELSSSMTLMPLSGWYVHVARNDDHEAS